VVWQTAVCKQHSSSNTWSAPLKVSSDTRLPLLNPSAITYLEKTGVTTLYWIYGSRGVLWKGVGRAHILKNMLLCIGLRFVRRTLFIGVPSPSPVTFTHLSSYWIYFGLISVNSAVNGVSCKRGSVSSGLREFPMFGWFPYLTLTGSGYRAFPVNPNVVLALHVEPAEPIHRSTQKVLWFPFCAKKKRQVK
jgi:hypothetical protein